MKICISGVKVHQDAGYGGGAKAILPGLAGLKTVEYNHTQILTKVRTTGPARVFKNDMRQDMIEAARMAKVDYTIQILYNDRLRPTQIWGGDIVEAHHAGCRVAAKTYCTPTVKDADIVVANGYPQNAQAFHGARWINYSVRDGGTGVVIVQHPLGLDPVHYLNNRLAGLSGATQFDLVQRKATYGELQKLIRNDLAILPLFQGFIAEGVKEGLQGFRPNINMSINCWNIREWYWA